MNGSGEVLQYTDNYPFGLEHNKVATFEELDPKNNYKYNGKELNTDLGLNWYNYGFRMYDPALGRFPSIDPIAEEFAFVSGFNYAENAPISNIDLHGLQKVFFQESLKNSGTFNDAYDINRNHTNQGKSFSEILSTQNKVSVLYVSTRYAGSGFTSKLFNDYKGFNEERKNNAQLKNSFLTLDDLNQVESIFEENPNNDFFVIGIDEFSCEKDCSTSAITEIASTLNHEEFHGERLLLGFPKHGATDHLLYYNLEEHDSPDDKDVLTLPVHKGSDAFINLHQIINYFLGNEN